MPEIKRYVVLPTRGIVGTTNVSQETLSALISLQALGRHTMSFQPAMRYVKARHPARPVKMRVIASIHENGAKLVEMTEEEALALRVASPGLRVVPEVRFQIARAPRIRVAASGRKAFPKARMGTVKVKVVTDDGPCPMCSWSLSRIGPRDAARKVQPERTAKRAWPFRLRQENCSA